MNKQQLRKHMIISCFQETEELTQSWTPRASFNPYVSPEYIPAASPAEVQCYMIYECNILEFECHICNRDKITTIKQIKIN